MENFKLNNLHFIFETINLMEKTNAEQEVLIELSKKGYSVIKSVNLKRRDWIGIPDFFVSNSKENFFVEVKTNGDGLRYEQVKWIYDNPNEKVIVYYLIQKTQENELRKIRRDEEKKRKDFQERVELARQASGIL